MDAVEKFIQDVQAGRIDAGRLIDVIGTLQRQLQAAQQELHAARQRIEELEKQAGGAVPPGPAKVAESFSVQAEEKRQQARQKKKKKNKSQGGRLSTADKIKQAERLEKCFPPGVPEENCRRSHTRVVWRLEKGRAVLIAYEIYRARNQYGQIAGVLGKSEFSLEIVVQIAYLVYVIGLSFDKVCQLLQFMQHLRLGKTQADALLRQLSRHWEHEFDVLCTLLANSLVVHADETGWSIHSAWAFLSEKARLIFFGVHKDGKTLKHILDPETFAGLVISDDAHVYDNFSQSQRCWAHLLRKAIKLTLQEPENQEYRRFTDRLLAIYREACRVQRDRRFSPAGRAEKVKALDDEILKLCGPQWILALPPLPAGPKDDFRRLVNEVMRVALERQLFTFVTAEPAVQPNGVSQPVAGTNNEAERTLRNPAMARDTGRANKATVGTRRQTIIVSVLESLRLYLPTFTLTGILEEINRWRQAGQSCFTKLLKQMELPPPTESILDKVIPLPDG